ncbi:hypothetical protein PIB30_027921 [Stylosanthes scabra]|uniref:RRM domain-containing protein n=1 Tax=Stylosanthes scabra TaxID=79078 RepID=A0ABU6ZBB3_9FABA|nr:hypothetical protein [Stylosanthes scabra]
MREKQREGERVGNTGCVTIRRRFRPTPYQWRIKRSNTDHRSRHNRVGLGHGGDRTGVERGDRRSGTVTVFVDNLPTNTTLAWLWKISSRMGRVADAFLSKKKRDGNKLPFAFVRFANRSEALRSVQNLDDWVVWGCRLSVSLAKYERTVVKNIRSIEGDNEGRHESEVEKCPLRDDNNVTDLGTLKLELDTDEGLLEIMSRGLIGETMEPVVFEEIKEAVLKDWHTMVGVKKLGDCKTTMSLTVWRTWKKKWKKHERGTTRRYWIEVYGLPCHAWTERNMYKIREVWGKVIKLGVLPEDHMNSFTVLNESGFGPHIQSWLNVVVEEVTYCLFVKEVAGWGGGETNRDETVVKRIGISRIDNFEVVRNGGEDETSRVMQSNSELREKEVETTGVQVGQTALRDAVLVENGVGTNDDNGLTENIWPDGSQSKTKTWEDDRDSSEVLERVKNLVDLGLGLSEEAIPKTQLNREIVEESWDEQHDMDSNPEFKLSRKKRKKKRCKSEASSGSGVSKAKSKKKNKLEESKKRKERRKQRRTQKSEGRDNEAIVNDTIEEFSLSEEKPKDRNVEADSTWLLGKELGLISKNDKKTLRFFSEEEADATAKKRRNSRSRSRKRGSKASTDIEVGDIHSLNQ